MMSFTSQIVGPLVMVGGAALAGTLWSQTDAIKEKLPFLNTTDSFTTNLVDDAKQGKFLRAYGREKEMDALITKITGGYGIVFLVGKPGVGKSALVYELARRIAEGSLSTQLNQAQILALNLQKINPKGLFSQIETLLNGGIKAIVEKIVKELGNRHTQGITSFLFIDECQDLLALDRNVFDNLRELLAQKEIHIIAASMDPDTISFWRKAEKSRARRSQIISIEAMSPKTMQEMVLPPLALSIGAEYTTNFSRTMPAVESSAIEACVFFSSILDKELPEPNRSTKLFREFVFHTGHKNMEGPFTNETVIRFIENTINESDAQSVIEAFSKHQQDVLQNQRYQQAKDRQTKFQESFLSSYFPPIERPCQECKPDIQDMATTLGSILDKTVKFPLTFECESQTIGTEVIYRASFEVASPEDRPFRRCSIESLKDCYDQYQTSGKVNIEDLVRRSLSKLPEEEILFIEEGSAILSQLEEIERTETSSETPTPIFHALKHGIDGVNNLSHQFLGQSLIPSSAGTSKSMSPRRALHPIENIFVQFIGNKKIKTILLKTPAPLPKQPLTPQKIALSSETIISNLISHLPSDVEETSKKPIAEKIMTLVNRMQLTSFTGKGLADTCHLLLIELKKTGNLQEDSSWLQAMARLSPALDPSRTKQEYLLLQETPTLRLMPVTAPIEKKPEVHAVKREYTYLNKYFPSHFDISLSKLQSERDTSIPLFVGDDCPTTLAFRKAQAAGWLTSHSRIVEFDLKEAFLRKDRGALLLDIEEYRQHQLQVHELMKTGAKVIIFGKTSLLPASSETGDIGTQLANLVDKGTTLVSTLTGTSTPNASTPLLSPGAIAYRSEPLTEQEKQLLLQYEIDTAIGEKPKPSEENNHKLIESYIYLWERLKKDTNGIAQEIKKDIPLLEDLSSLTTTQIAEFFSGILTSQIPSASPLEMTYLLTPKETPWRYWIWRKVTDPIIYTFNFASWAVRSIMSYATGQIIGWITGLPFWRFASGLKKLAGW